VIKNKINLKKHFTLSSKYDIIVGEEIL